MSTSASVASQSPTPIDIPPARSLAIPSTNTSPILMSVPDTAATKSTVNHHNTINAIEPVTKTETIPSRPP
jgi:hypothetical protein